MSYIKWTILILNLFLYFLTIEMVFSLSDKIYELEDRMSNACILEVAGG